MVSIQKYVYIDGDNIGLKIESSFLENDEDSLITINNQVKLIVKEITDSLIELGQEIIFSGADGIICKGNKISNLHLLKTIRSISRNITFSIGSGNSLSDCYIALRYAKSKGKNIAVDYSDSKYLIEEN